MPLPRKDGQPKVYTEKIQSIVNEISKLTLGEVSDLNSLLKVCLIKLKPLTLTFHIVLNLGLLL